MLCKRITEHTRFSSRRSIAASNSHGRFVAASTNTKSFVFVNPSICNAQQHIKMKTKLRCHYNNFKPQFINNKSGNTGFIWNFQTSRNLNKQLSLQAATSFVLATSFTTLANNGINLIKKYCGWCMMPSKLEQNFDKLLWISCTCTNMCLTFPFRNKVDENLNYMLSV